MPETPPSPLAQSPGQMAAARFWRKSGARWGAVLVVFMILTALYQPFLSHDIALVWIDDRGIFFPLFAEFFNSKAFTQRHDLLFNLAGLLMPFLVIAACFLRKQIGFWRIIKTWFGVLLGSWILCQIPCIPKGESWTALWTDRAETALKGSTLQRIETQSKRPDSVIPGDLRVDATGKLWTLTAVIDSKRGYFLPVAGGGGLECDLASMREPNRPWTILPIVPHACGRSYEGHPYAPPLTVNIHSGSRYWLGADATGRDILSRMVSGTRISLTVGLVATGLSLGIGIILGAISGYFGGWIDLVIQRIVEIMMMFPTFILILIVVAMWDRSIFVIMGMIGVTSWASTARLVRGEFLQQSSMEYVLAARALGLPRRRIMFQHILPNTMTPIIITASFGVAGSVLVESTLAFIGLGDPNIASWGGMLADAREIPLYGWLIYPPGIAIFVLVFSLNLIGNALREALDPKHAA